MKKDAKIPTYRNGKLTDYIVHVVYDQNTMLAWDSEVKTTAAYGDLHEGIGDGRIHLVGDKLITY